LDYERVVENHSYLVQNNYIGDEDIIIYSKF
jgi:hypothetical protein